MRAGRLAAVGALATVMSACGGGISVSSDWDPGVDFASYRTFAVLDEATGEQLPPFVEERVRTSIANTLTAKGMQRVDNPQDADAAVGFQFTTDQRSSYQTVNTGWGGYGYGGYGGWYGSGMSVGTSTTTERVYDVGTLVIAVFDVEQEQMIFASTGSKTLEDRQMSPEESQARIDEAVESILRDFPPGS